MKIDKIRDSSLSNKTHEYRSVFKCNFYIWAIPLHYIILIVKINYLIDPCVTFCDNKKLCTFGIQIKNAFLTTGHLLWIFLHLVHYPLNLL